TSGTLILSVAAQSTRQHPGASWSPSGERLAVLRPNGEVRLLDGLTGSERWRADAGADARLGAWSSTSTAFETIIGDARKRWDAATSASRPMPPGERNDTPDFHFAVIFSADDTEVILVDGVSGAERWRVKARGKAAYLSPNHTGPPIDVNRDGHP